MGKRGIVGIKSIEITRNPPGRKDLSARPCRNKLKAVLVLFLLVFAFTGCGTTRSYHGEIAQVVQSSRDGNISNALANLENNNSGEEKDLLYYFEKGELLHLKNDLPLSTTAWLSADEKVRLWEDEVKKDPAKLFGDIASYVVNDKARRYDGLDFEKVMLSTLLATNHVLLGNWSAARVEIKKTHEREAVIADFRSKEIDKIESDRKEKGVSTTYKDLKGYPVETLDDPDVVNLKNGYQNAFSHYFAGYVYEALGEPSLSAPGYRKAIELRPNVGILEAGLNGLDGRRKQLKPLEADVLFVVSSGMIPARQSMKIPFPVPVGKRSASVVSISFPVIKPDRSVFLPNTIQVANQTIPVTAITSLDAMACRALRDEMPSIILRSTIRALEETGAHVAAKEMGGTTGAITTLLTYGKNIVFEHADERSWRTLPAQIAIARATLPKGKQTVSIQTPFGPSQFEVTINDQYAVVPIRLMGNSVYVAQGMGTTDLLMLTKEEIPTVSDQPKKKKTRKR